VTLSAYQRDRETARSACGVRLSPNHVLSRSVHAFRTWTGERALETWCGIPVDLTAGGARTSETITCQACPQASWLAFKGIDWRAS
jgi:hypothetical protein